MLLYYFNVYLPSGIFYSYLLDKSSRHLMGVWFSYRSIYIFKMKSHNAAFKIRKGINKRLSVFLYKLLNLYRNTGSLLFVLSRINIFFEREVRICLMQIV